MKTFKTFISEMVWYVGKSRLPTGSKRHGDASRITYHENPRKEFGPPISTMPSGHQVFKSKDSTDIHAWNPETKELDITLHGFHYGDKVYEKQLSSSRKRTLKAHELYAHLIKHHGVEIQSDTTHSYGARKVWQKLAADPEIKVTPIDRVTKKKVSRRNVYQVPADAHASKHAEYRADNYVLIAKKRGIGSWLLNKALPGKKTDFEDDA